MPDPAVPLYPYQRRWVQDRRRFKLGRWARQTGKTFTTTLEIVDSCYAAAAERAGRRRRWVILSRGERQAREAMTAGVIPHAKAYGLAVDVLDAEWKAESGTIYQTLEARLPAGHITAIPANPETARGFSASVFLDEFAWHRDSRAIWASLFPVVSAGHDLRVTSTPNGKGNKFYELASAKDDTWSRHSTDIHQAVADGLPRDVDEMRAALADDELWRQEYELEWMDGASAWLTYDLIDSVEDAGAGDPGGYRGGRVVIGNDIGRRRDLWVAWVLELDGPVAWTREISELAGKTFAAHDAELDRLRGLYRPEAIWMDQTGLGEKPVEDAIHRYGASVVNGVIFSAPRRLDLASSLRRRIQDRHIRIPAGQRALRADLHAVKRRASGEGAPRLVVDDESGEAGSHADRFWAGALACAAAEGTTFEAGYQPVRPAADGDEDDDNPGDRWGAYAPAAARWGGM